MEQVLNTFLPAVQVAQTLKKLNLPVPPALEEKLPKVVSKGLERIIAEQHQVGGWGWYWGNDYDAEMTAYVIYGLIEAKAAGYKVPDQTLDRGLQLLMAKASKVEDPSLRAYLLYVLSLRPPDFSYLINSLRDTFQQRSRLSDSGLAMLAMTAQHINSLSYRNSLMQLLKEHTQRASGIAFWERTAKYEKWSRNEIEITAWVLRAFNEIDPANPLVHDVVRFLVTHRQGDHWYSSKDTAAVVSALAEYAKVSGEMQPSYQVQVWLNGKPVKTLTVEPKDFASPALVIKLKSSALQFGPNQIRIAKQGDGVLWYAAALRYYNTAEPLKAIGRDLTVQRTYYRLVSRTKRDGTIERVPVRLREGEPLRAGQVIEVKLDLRLRQPAQYLVVEDPLPAGFEVVTEDINPWSWSYWWSGQEIHDDRMAHFLSWIHKGKQSLTYRLRAELPGELHVMPTRIYSMYLPDQGGNGREDRLRVRLER